MRTLIQALTLAVGLALAAPTVSHAASAQVKEQKARVKDAKKDLKELDKVIKKYGKAVNKSKDTSKLDGQIRNIVQRELGELRAQGVNIDGPKPEAGGRFEGDPHKLNPPPSDTPVLDKMRDQVQALQAAKKPTTRLKELRDLRPLFASRLKRQEQRLNKVK